MNTNFQMLRELLKEYHPKKRGIASAEERKLVEETLCIKEMNVLALRNLRDFTVLFLGKSVEAEDWDRLIAIASIIDAEIIQKGGEV